MLSTRCRFSLSAIVALAAMLVAALPALAGEEVDLSRYKYTLTDPPGPPGTRVSVDHTAIQDLCRDDDGCLVTLRMDAGDVLDVSESRLFLFEDSQRWKALPLTLCPAICEDANGVGQPLMPTGDGINHSCLFTDAENPGGGDALEGWALFALSATCVVVVSD